MFNEGLPQGSDLSSTLFTICINILLDKYDDSTLLSAYVDDLMIARIGRNKDQVTKNLVKEIIKIADWSVEAQLTLNTSNSHLSLWMC